MLLSCLLHLVLPTALLISCLERRPAAAYMVHDAAGTIGRRLPSTANTPTLRLGLQD